MTVSILNTLGVLPSGAMGPPLTLEELGAYLRKTCDRVEDRDRERRHAIRDELFRDGGVDYMNWVIDQVFMDPTVREHRKRWVKHARFNNGIKRIVTEKSTVYSEPARRTVANAEANRRYQDLLAELDFDITAQEINRMFNLHQIILVGFRVRQMPDDAREPVVDVATPCRFRLVLHPNDSSMVIGFLIKTEFRSARTLPEREAQWVLWTDHERVRLDKRMAPIQSTYVVHGLNVCPWMLITRFRSIAGIWPGEEGEDLVAGQTSVWMSNVLLLKEQKSATRQTLLSGDLSGAARGQVADTEVPAELPEGVAVQSIDASMDLTMFQGTADHVMRTLAANHGFSANLLEHQGVQSGEARELMRVPIRELRKEQQPMFRRFERKFVDVMVAILQSDDSARAFSTDGWRIDFGESQTPLTENEDLDLFEKKKRLGLDNTEDFMIRRNPDLDDKLARAAIDHNIEVETMRVGKLKKLQALQGGVATGVGDDSRANLRAIPGGKADDVPPEK